MRKETIKGNPPVVKAASERLPEFNKTVGISEFWGFMLWWLHSIAQLIDETTIASPGVLKHFQEDDYLSPKELGVLIKTRFMSRILGGFGFIVIDTEWVKHGRLVSQQLVGLTNSKTRMAITSPEARQRYN